MKSIEVLEDVVDFQLFDGTEIWIGSLLKFHTVGTNVLDYFTYILTSKNDDAAFVHEKMSTRFHK